MDEEPSLGDFFQHVNDATTISTNQTSIDDDYVPEQIPTSGMLSDEQDIVLIILTIFSALLSLIGSCTIVYKILRCLFRKKKITPYDRIILGLSSLDILGCLTHMVGPFLLPSETSLRVWAIGSPYSCQFLGLLIQFSVMGAVWYNGLLSFYYLLTVRFRVLRQDFVKKYEPWIHISALFFPVTAIVGYLFNWYAEQDLSMTCWAKYPLVGYIFGGVPLVVAFLSVAFNNIIIYVYVRKTLFSAQLRSRNSNAGDVESLASGDTFGLTPKQKRLRKEVATQGFLYVASFMLTTAPVLTIQLLGGAAGYTMNDQGKIYWLLILNAMLFPLQGFFNVFIYVRPTFSRFRAAKPEEHVTTILKLALFEPDIPKMTSAAESSEEIPANVATKRYSNARRKSASNFVSSLEQISEVVKDFSESSSDEDTKSEKSTAKFDLIVEEDRLSIEEDTTLGTTPVDSKI